MKPEEIAALSEAEERIERAKRDEAASLDLSRLCLVQLPESLGELRMLRRLYLQGNQLSSLPEFLCELKALEELSLHNNLLNSLPESLGQMKALRELYLPDNQLGTLPESLGELKTLRKLSLENNRLGALPNSLGGLKSLEELFLQNNQITVLPDSVGELKALTWLSLYNNRIASLPESLGELKELRVLNLQDNRIRGLPESLGNMKGLEVLSLQNNQLSILPKTLGWLKKLQVFDLQNNELASLPESLSWLRKLRYLFLHGNPRLGLGADVLGPTYEEIMRGSNRRSARASDLLAYYFSAKRAAAPLNEVKMLLVGRGGVGKSSIRDCLLGFGFDPRKKETPGIEITQWPLKHGKETVRLHVWDFAGQELTHGTHQFFLTERSVYVLVLDARADTQDGDAQYWLHLVTAFGGDSPIIVALNKYESKPFDVDRHAIQERYPTVRAFVETDCETGFGLEKLKDAIRSAMADMKSVHEPFPAEWLAAKDAFSAMAENYVAFNEFRKECDAQGIKKPEDQEMLARILHRLGIVLHYADDPRLRDTTVLRPHWVTESIYRLLRLKEGPQSDGTLSVEEACSALPKEKPDMVRYLIGLMRRFELCFPVGETAQEEDRWLVPELLPRFQPALDKRWQAVDALRLRYNYKVLPEGLLPRFITRTYPLSQNQLRWRSGVVLEMDGAQALVRAGGTQVNVVIVGEIEGRQRLAKLIRNHFSHIHADLKGLEPEEQVEVEGHPGTFKSVVTLELDERTPEAVTTIETKNGSVKIDQTKELDRFSARAARNPQQKKLRLFLSYSHRDARLRDVFQENLALLEQDGLLEWWFDGKVLPSAEWDREIRNELEQADIVVFMVSVPFLASHYIRGVEMEKCLILRKGGGAEIVSVILEDCAWQDREFTKYQVVLPGGKPVRKWNWHRGAFNEVEKPLRRLIAQMLTNRSGEAQSLY
jgi:internalin A